MPRSLMVGEGAGREESHSLSQLTAWGLGDLGAETEEGRSKGAKKLVLRPDDLPGRRTMLISDGERELADEKAQERGAGGRG